MLGVPLATLFEFEAVVPAVPTGEAALIQADLACLPEGEQRLVHALVRALRKTA